MRTINRFILSLAAALVAVDVLLATLGQQDFSVYYILNSIVFLIVALAHVNLNPRSRHGLGMVAFMLFAGFVASAAVKIGGS